MTSSSLYALQSAVYSTLRSDSALAGVMGSTESPEDNRVYDAQAPDGAAFPYIIMGSMNGRDWDSKTEDGMDVMITLHVYSIYRGYKEMRQMQGAIIDALDQQSISLSGHSLVQLTYEESMELEQGGEQQDREGLIRRSVMRFRALTQGT